MPDNVRIEDIDPRIIDYSSSPIWFWFLRRTGIATIIFLFYTYAIVFVMGTVFPDYFAKSISASVGNIGPEGKNLVLMITFGFLGGVFAVTRGYMVTVQRSDMPLSWYVTRPLQGMLMAMFIYYAFRAGQLVFYSGDTGAGGATSINVYTLSIIAIVTGLFTENAYKSMQNIARRIRSPGTRPTAPLGGPPGE